MQEELVLKLIKLKHSFLCKYHYCPCSYSKLQSIILLFVLLGLVLESNHRLRSPLCYKCQRYLH